MGSPMGTRASKMFKDLTAKIKTAIRLEEEDEDRFRTPEQSESGAGGGVLSSSVVSCVGDAVPDAIKDNLRQLLKCHPKGLHVDELKKVYQVLHQCLSSSCPNVLQFFF